MILILFPSSYLIYNGFELIDIGNYKYIGTIYLGKFSFLFTLLCVGLLTNAINYTDGIDGLALSIVISCIIYFIFLSNDYNLKFLFYLFLIPLTINLIFNFFQLNLAINYFWGTLGVCF